MLDIHAIMGSLAMKRPIFHSEADFQHALAWEIRKAMPKVRLEYPVKVKDFISGREKSIALDIWIPTGQIAIELKYFTNLLGLTYRGEEFSLAEQGRQTPNRYDYVKDIQRIESVLAASKAEQGFAILLTNEFDYWKIPSGELKANDISFRIHEGQELPAGELRWLNPNKSAAKGKEEPIHLKNSYHLEWKDYSFPIGDSGNKVQVSEETYKKILQLEEEFNRFRYLAVHVRDL